MKLGSESLRIYLSKPPEENEKELNDKTAYVLNLPSDITEQKIRDVFESCGKIEDIRIKKSSLNKLFAYIQFSNNSSVVAALKFHGQTLFDQNQEITVEKTRSKEEIRKEKE